MPTSLRTRRRGLRKHRGLKRGTRRLRRHQRGGATAFDLNVWLAAVRADMASPFDLTRTIQSLAKPELAIPADASDTDFLEAAARVRAVLIRIALQIKDDINNYDGPIATVFTKFCSQTAEEEVTYLKAVEKRLRNTDVTVNICDTTSYPLYIWYVAANTPDIPVSVDFGEEETVRAALSEPRDY